MNTLAPLSVHEAEGRVLGWQTKLHRWAVKDEQQRFGDLFNLVCDPATLLVAWERVKKEQTAEFMREQMRLTLPPEKTHVTHVDDGFDLLGFRIVRAPWRGSKRVAYAFPSKRALREIMHRIKTLTNRSTLNLSLDQLIYALNPILRGWANYHRHNAAKRCFAYLSYYLWWRVIRWLRKKYPRLTWKQLRRRCWGRHWTSREGTRLAWPAEVPVTRYRYRGHNIPPPWAATGPGRATTRPETAVA